MAIKKLAFALSFLLNPFVSTFGQSNDPISSSYTYHVSYVKNGTTLVDDICILDVAKAQSYFYSNGKEILIKKLADASSRTPQGGTETTFSSKDFKRNFYKSPILKNYKTKQVIVIEKVELQQLAAIKDTLSGKEWVLTKERKTINNIPCYKALLKKGTLTTTAWFSPTIPIQEGPFHYYGLPGLIVNVQNSEGWEAELVKVNANKERNNTLKTPRYALVSAQQMEKAKKNAKALAAQGISSTGDRAEKVKN